MPDLTPDLERLAINKIRTLSIDGVQKANSGQVVRRELRGRVPTLDARHQPSGLSRSPTV